MFLVGDPNPSPRIRALRVAVAKDALQQLDQQKFRLTSGMYFSALVALGFNIEPQQDLRDVLPSLQECHVCALGACLLSLAAVNDKIPATHYFSPGGRGVNDTTRINNDLRAAFDNATQRVLEGYFERWPHRFWGAVADRGLEVTDELSAWIGDGLQKYAASEDRFRHLMQHLIDNDGVIDLEGLFGPMPTETKTAGVQ